MEELKTRSFRITDNTADKIKELAGEIGGNQQEVIAKLIEAYEFQKGKAVLTSKKDDIEKFEQYASILTRMYMNSLEDNQNITETVRTEFESQLKSKDLLIASLQQENEKIKTENLTVLEDSKILLEDNKILKDKVEEKQKELEEKKKAFEDMLKDKEDLNQALTLSINEMRNRLESLESKLSSVEELESKVIELQTEKKNLESVTQQSNIEHEKELLAKEKIYQETLQKLKADHQSEIDTYQSKYFDLVQTMQGDTVKAKAKTAKTANTKAKAVTKVE